MTDERKGAFRGVEGELEEGILNQAAGAVENAYSKTLEAAAEGAQTAKEVAIASHDFLREFIEEKPYTTAAIALGMGLLIGYTAHRPPPKRSWWD
jgi:ElaB/YqjD/DUF883 family membrane-anchored ribosome-binding protein